MNWGIPMNRLSKKKSLTGKGTDKHSDPDGPYRRLASEVIYKALQDYRRAYATNHPSQYAHANWITSDTVWHRALRIDEEVYPRMLKKIREVEDAKRHTAL